MPKQRFGVPPTLHLRPSLTMIGAEPRPMHHMEEGLHDGRMEMDRGAKFEGVITRLGNQRPRARRPRQLVGPPLGLGRGARTGELAPRSGSTPRIGISGGLSMTTTTAFGARETRRSWCTVAPRHRSGWPPYDVASPVAPTVHMVRMAPTPRCTELLPRYTALGRNASMERMSTLVSLRPQRVIRRELAMRQGQVKTVKFTRLTCMGDEFNPQLARIEVSWAPTWGILLPRLTWWRGTATA